MAASMNCGGCCAALHCIALHCTALYYWARRGDQTMQCTHAKKRLTHSSLRCADGIGKGNGNGNMECQSRPGQVMPERD